ncbi:M16 family metallopeptidase [Blattabacterium cuenoti]|uniref:M16 family metallopeptidase n=1 Tax=Blattabacterium cuenoti TaxID=1653831 RepID=UPI001CC234F9|nr:pitrilysin family protein [Blattabacterium cuenoti]
MRKINFIEENLSNGLHVIYHQEHTQPIISVSVLYHVGSKDEPVNKTGLAHFFEHLMFEGSKNLKQGEYFKYIASNGGYNNAYTNHDETCYYGTLPSSKLPLILWLESERMFYSNVDKKCLDIQKKIVKEEKKSRTENHPYVESMTEIIPSLLFQTHPYKYPIIGLSKDLDDIKEEDYNEFYHKYYIPNNAILSISGDFNLLEAKNLVKKYFLSSSEKKNKKLEKRKIFVEKPIEKEIFYQFIDKNSKIPAVFFSYRFPNVTSKDAYIMRIIDDIFSSGKSSPFKKSIVNVKQVAAYAGSFLESMEDYGLFVLYAILNTGVHLENLCEAMDEEIDLFKEQGITSYELTKQQNLFEKYFTFENYYIGGISSNLNYYATYYKNANLINEEIDTYRKVSQKEIQEVANKYLNKNNRVRLYNLPEDY